MRTEIIITHQSHSNSERSRRKTFSTTKIFSRFTDEVIFLCLARAFTLSNGSLSGVDLLICLLNCPISKPIQEFYLSALLQAPNGAMAFLGYLMYREYLKSQVTLNLPIGNIITEMAIYITLISPLTKYALVMTPIATAIVENFQFCSSRSISILSR